MSSAENPPVAKEISGEDESAPIIAAIPTGVSINADPIAQHQNTGVCRGCGQEFVRNAGVHDGMAQYYRCNKCDHITFRTLVDNLLCRMS